MKAAMHTEASVPEALVGEYLLAKVGGTQFMVRVLSTDANTMRISFPGSDNPLENTWLDLELHDEDGILSFRGRVLEGTRERGSGLLLEYPSTGIYRLHRDAFRVPTDLVAQVRDESEARRYSAAVVNLSSGGALLEMDAPIGEQSVIAMLLSIPRERHCRLTGEVVHMRQQRRTPLTVKGLFGVRFVDPEQPARESLSHYVGERLRHLASVD